MSKQNKNNIYNKSGTKSSPISLSVSPEKSSKLINNSTLNTFENYLLRILSRLHETIKRFFN